MTSANHHSSFHVYRIGGLLGDDKVIKTDDRTTVLCMPSLRTCLPMLISFVNGVTSDTISGVRAPRHSGNSCYMPEVRLEFLFAMLSHPISVTPR